MAWNGATARADLLHSWSDWCGDCLHTQPIFYIFFSFTVCASAILHALARSGTSSSVCTYTVCIPLCTHLCFICVSVCAPAYISPRPQPRFLTFQLRLRGVLTPNLQSSLPPSLPHLSIHLTEGFTLLTVKFTHIHNYVFNQSHLKASRMQPFSGNGRRSTSTLRGLSGLIPAFALPANDWQIFRDGSSQVREAFNLQSGTLGLHAPQHVDPLANQYDCRYWIIHGCLMMCQSQMVLFYLSRSMHRFVRPPSSIAS